MDAPERFRDRTVTLAGVVGHNVEIPSANPVNYHQAINDTGGCEPLLVDGKLFLPPADGPLPVVVVVPGSLGVGESHLLHAATLLEAGYAAFVLDPFGPRSVESTVANQTHYSFAASAFDVLATLRALADLDAIDTDRICAQGHSRGGSAVLTAAVRSFADPIVGERLILTGAYAVYPWCGHQFAHPDVGSTRVRAIVGDRDDWLSVQQVQSQVQAIGLTGGDASLRVVGGASHSFDRSEELHELPEASVAPGAPTTYIDGDGAMVDYRTGASDVSTTDREMFMAGIHAGFGRWGAHIGSTGDQPEVFRQDMLDFHAEVLSRTQEKG